MTSRETERALNVQRKAEMLEILKHRDITAAEMVARFGCLPHTANNLVGSLSKAGLIIGYLDPDGSNGSKAYRLATRMAPSLPSRIYRAGDDEALPRPMPHIVPPQWSLMNLFYGRTA